MKNTLAKRNFGVVAAIAITVFAFAKTPARTTTQNTFEFISTDTNFTQDATANTQFAFEPTTTQNTVEFLSTDTTFTQDNTANTQFAFGPAIHSAVEVL